MITKIYDVPKDQIETLKNTFYDVESYKTIMTELAHIVIEKTLDYSIFNDFRLHYKNALIAYEQAKFDFEFDFVKTKHSNATFWNVTFGDNKVEIHYPE